MKHLLLPGLLTVLFFSACRQQTTYLSAAGIDPFHYQVRKEVKSASAAVVSAHPLASLVGMSILKKGGNAVDAAIATQLALAVVYPGAGNIGGGGFMVAHLADGKNLSIDFREKAPSRAGRNMYLDSAGGANTDLSQQGHLSVGVPGTIAGLFAEHRYGHLPFADLIEPAIELAENGFALSAAEAESLNENQAEFKKYNTVMPVFVRARAWKEGDTLLQKDLAATLRRIRDLGQAGFYGGETARMIADEMKRGHGLLTEEDLRNYQAVERKPVICDYRGYTVVTMPLPSSGGILLPQMLHMVEDFPLGSYGFESARAVQLMTEAERRAYADRALYLGDPDFYKVPVDSLLSRTYARQRMKDYVPGKAGNSEHIKAGVIHESDETTHLCVYDEQGNAVSITTTLNGGYGSHTVVAGAGFLLNDEMDDFSVKPGVPNMYGALGGDANAIEPGKRMLSSMSPTIVLRNGKTMFVTGTPGGTTIITSVFQTLVDLIDFGLDPSTTVNAPKFHHQWKPDLLELEKGFPAAVRDSLEKMGYTCKERGAIGRTELIVADSSGHVHAVGDHRGEDDAEGKD